MKYAVFSVSIPTYEPSVAVERVAANGYDGIEWRVLDQDPSTRGSGFWSNNLATLPFTTLVEDAQKWRDITAKAGLEITGLGTYVKAGQPDAIEFAMLGAQRMGAKQLRVSAPGYDGLSPFAPIWEKAREDYKVAAELAAKYNVKALLELHHRTIAPSASSAVRLLDGLDPAHIGVIHDIGNMAFEGYETPRMGFEVLGPYLAHVHVKNARWFPEKYNTDGTVTWKCDWAPVHKGVMDMRLLFSSLHAVGYDDWIGIEDFSSEGTVEDRLKNNLAYLKILAAETRNSAN